MNLDLSKFKKVEAGDKHTILSHENGHTLKIAHKGLSDSLRKQLEEMPVNLAKGGYAKFSQKFDPNYKKGMYQERPGHGVGPEAAGLSQVSKSSQPSKDPSYNEPMDTGTAAPVSGRFGLPKLSPTKASNWAVQEPQGKQMYPPCINPSCKSYGHSHPNCRCYGGVPETGKFAEGGEVSKEYYCDSNRAHFKKCELYAEGGDVKGVHKSYYDDGEGGESKAGALARNIDLGKGRKENAVSEHHKVLGEMKSMPKPKIQGFADGGEADPQPQQELASSPAPEPTPDGGQQLPQDDQMAQAPQQDAPAATDDNKQDLDNEMAQADQAGDRTPAAVNPSSPAQDPATQVAQAKDQHMAQLSNEANAYQSDVDAGNITPETYHDLFAKKDTLGKIGTLFGLLVGGAGAGLSHQPNAILEMMNKEIDRDLQAQQHSVENKQSFLKINQQALSGQADAGIKVNALNRVMMNSTALHSLVQDTLKLPQGSPQRMKAEQTLAMMNEGVQNENFNILDRAATASALAGYLGGGQGGKNTKLMKSGLLGPEAKEVGEDTEQKNIPGVGEATRPVPENDRAQIQAMKVLSDKAQDLISFSKGNIATLSPAKRAIAQQKAAEMVNFYNASIQGGVLSQGRLGWLDDQIKKNPTGVVTQLMGNNARLQEIKDSNDHRRNLLLQSYGVPVPKQSSQGASSAAPQFKMVNGVKYTKGPNGEAIKVK